MVLGIGVALLTASPAHAGSTPRRSDAPTSALSASSPPVLAFKGPSRYAESDVVLQLKPGRRFLPAPPGSVRSGSPSLDDRLARAGAVAALPLFPIEGADRALHAALGLDRFYRVHLRRPADIPSLAAELARHADVAHAEPDYEGSTAETGVRTTLLPNDPSFDRQWGFRNSGFVPGIGTSTPGADIKAAEGWSVTTGDSNVVVAVLDSGLRYDYPDFAGRVWSNAGEIPGNHLDDDGNGYVDDVRGYNFAYGSADVLDDLGHGTAVSGIIGAVANDGLGYCGLDWACKIMPVKILNYQGFGFYSWWVSGLYYAANEGARVINMSLVGLEPSIVLQTAIRYAHARGCLIAAAMGNSGTNVRYIPASYEAEVVAVGATERHDQRAFFSTYGNHIDVVAPGQEIAILTLGTETYSSYGSGTSFAAPMVAGLAALLLAKQPSLGADELCDVICATADDQVGGAQDAPGFDPYHGYGRINCGRAVTLDRIPHAPVVTAPTWVNGAEGHLISIAVSASDPDGDPILRLDADFSVLPQTHDAVFTANATATAGTFTWTPTGNDAGPYSMTFRAYDPLRGLATTTIMVANTNQPPRLIAPESVSFTEGDGGQFDIQADDPDFEELLLSASAVPAGARFVDNANNTGTFTWVPEAGQAGSYTVRFTVTDGSGESAGASTRIDVSRVDLPPQVSAPSSVEGDEGTLVTFAVSALDPDGDAIESLTADLRQLPVNHGATFVLTGAGGLFSWTPSYAHSGSYPVVVIAQNGASTSVTIQISIRDVDRAPEVTAPERVAGGENELLTVPVSAADPDGDPLLTLTAVPLPSGATFEAAAERGTGTIRWTPDFGQAGAYEVVVAATSAMRAAGVSGATHAGTATVRFEITNVNRAPVAVAGGPYAGVAGSTVSFDGSASSDPDGDGLRYAWDFGDGASALGATPGHAFGEGGDYTVTLEVSDGSLAHRASTTARIAGSLPARAFLPNGHRSISLVGTAPSCIQLEPVLGSYANSDVDPSSLALVSVGTGSVSSIAPVLRSIVEGDRDKNGVPDISLCFEKGDLRRLFDKVSGRQVVSASVEGRVAGGAKIRATLSFVVVGTGGGSIAVSSNPLTSGGLITLRTATTGRVRVRLFDARGRLVRTLVDQPAATAGYHDVPFDGRGPLGNLSSGIYFLHGETPDGVTTSRIAILR